MAAHDIRFEPGVNEDLAATMILGTQELDAFPGKKFDGVFGMWYGKGPGVDRSGDAFHCANMAGTHRHGGVLAISGDDHGAHSSTYPHQTEYVFQNVFMPVLNPASVQDVLDLGLAGWALSRYSGLWVAMKTTAETMEQAATAIVHSGAFRHAGLRAAAARAELRPFAALPRRPRRTRTPHDRGTTARRSRLGARQPAGPVDQRHRRRADRPDYRRQGARGHAARAARMGLDRHPQLAIYKIGMTWPLETEGLREIRPRQTFHPRDRGKARLRRVADPRRAVSPAGR
jgi:indolepyruvate ferredoxin oxidoreductase